MKISLLSPALTRLEFVDKYESLIWTDRFDALGDFELILSANLDIVNRLVEEFFLKRSDSQRLMVIENVTLKTDAVEGDKVIIKGRSLESFLYRRIVWGQVVLSGNLQTALKTLLENNAIVCPGAPDRVISRLEFAETDDSRITGLTVDDQFKGAYIYDVVEKICQKNGLGFHIILTPENKFEFKLYVGQDRSYTQLANPHVVFSPKFNNLVSSEYNSAMENLRTVTLVGGEGEGIDQRMAVAESPYGAGTDLNRREIYTDASSVSSKVDGGTLSDPVYIAQLQQKGLEKLNEHEIVETFQGELDPVVTFTYERDFSIGDIIQVDDGYGHKARSRVNEVIHSHDTASGDRVYPTFVTL